MIDMSLVCMYIYICIYLEINQTVSDLMMEADENVWNSSCGKHEYLNLISRQSVQKLVRRFHCKPEILSHLSSKSKVSRTHSLGTTNVMAAEYLHRCHSLDQRTKIDRVTLSSQELLVWLKISSRHVNFVSCDS